MKFGEMISTRRKELRLTQQELALKCGYANKSSINKIENGSHGIPGKEHMLNLARVLDIPYKELVQVAMESIYFTEEK